MLVQSVISALKKAIGAFLVHPLPKQGSILSISAPKAGEHSQYIQSPTKYFNTAQDLMENVQL